MKILVAEGDHLCVDDVKSLFSNGHEITTVSSISGLLHELTTGRHDFLVCDCAVEGWDIFRISHLLNSFRYAEFAIPLFVLKETCPFDIAPSVSRAYQIHLVDSADLCMTLKRLHSEQKYQDKTVRKTLTVLIVEDHVQTAQLLAAYLRKKYIVEVAFDGASAYELWQYKRHNVVLMDIGLPDISGTAVLRKILDADPYQAIIMVTGEDAPNLSIEMVYAGAWDYFKKPFDFRALQAKIAVVAKLSEIERLNGYHEMRTFKASSYLAEIEDALFEGRSDDAMMYVQSFRQFLEGEQFDDDYRDIKAQTDSIELAV